MLDVWVIHVRDPLRQRQALLDDYSKFEAIRRFNRVGTWQIDVSGSSTAGLLLTQPGWGIEVVQEDDTTPAFSGPATAVSRSRGASTDTVTVSGVDDIIHLEDRLAHPQPGSSAPPYSTTEHDVRTGVCSTILRQYVDVNAGPSAVSQRRVLTLAGDPVVGSTVTGRARWVNLREFLEGLALSGGGLRFDVEQDAEDLVFRVSMPEDKSDAVKFSLDIGNLGTFDYSASAPSVSYVYCGGNGEGTARTIQEGQNSADIVDWSRRIERFADRRDTSDTGELGQEITKALEEGKGETGLSFVPVDLPGMTFGVDYDLGDRISAVLDDEITEVIREVKVTQSPDSGLVAVPSIGTSSFRDTARLFRRLVAAESRLLWLERR